MNLHISRSLFAILLLVSATIAGADDGPVNADMVLTGGTIYDDAGNIIKVYEARLPAVLEFAVPAGCRSLWSRPAKRITGKIAGPGITS